MRMWITWAIAAIVAVTGTAVALRTFDIPPTPLIWYEVPR